MGEIQTPPVIRRLTSTAPADIEAAARTLDAAFCNEVAAVAVNNHVPGLNLARQRATLTEAISDPRLDVLVIDGEGGDVAAMVIVTPPGFVARSPDPSVPHNAAVAALLTPELVAAGQDLGSKLLAIKHRAFGEENMDKMYWVGRLGTNTAYQRRGLSTILLRTLIERARAEGKDIALTTPTPHVRDWYQRLGFKVVLEDDFTTRGVYMTWWAMRWSATS